MADLSQPVIGDLILLYKSGEASEETVILIDEWIKKHPETNFFHSQEKEFGLPRIETPLGEPDEELRQLRRIRKMMQWRSWSLVLSLLFLFISVRFEFYFIEKFLLFFRNDPLMNSISITIFIVFLVIFLLLQKRLKQDGF